MFRSISLRGTQAAVLWGYRQAATLRTWSISQDKTKGQWVLAADVERADPFQCRQGPLLFSAPRRGGYWCWPVEKNTLTIQGTQLRATLGPPEQ